MSTHDIDPELLAAAADIGRRILAQDNRSTDAPLFVVQEKRRFYGLDPEWADADEIVWIDTANDSVEAVPEEHDRLEAAWDEYGYEPDGWARTSFKDEWHFVTACFTEAGCKEYVRANAHNHRGELRIYADGSYRNEEWRAVRRLLIAIAGGAP
jgi:hypothetical protein